MAGLSLDELYEKFENIYEAVEVMALRARQVTDEQKREIESEISIKTDSEPDVDEFGSIEIDRSALNREFKKFPKPTVVAINEALRDEIEFRYISPEEETPGKEKKEK